MKLPRVTGFIPVYNAERFLLKTLESIASNDYPNFNIIIGDDCSSDKSVQIAQDFANSDPRFEVVVNKTNLGWYQNSERLWFKSASQSQYCFLISHDDFLKPNFITSQINQLESNLEAVLCVPQMEINPVSGEKFPMPQLFDFCNSDKQFERVALIISQTRNYWWAAYHGIHRSSAVLKTIPTHHFLFNNFEFTMDLIWLLRMTLIGKFITVSDYLYQKNLQNDSCSAKWEHTASENTFLQLYILKEILLSNLLTSQKQELIYLLTKRILRIIQKKSVRTSNEKFLHFTKQSPMIL